MRANTYRFRLAAVVVATIGAAAQVQALPLKESYREYDGGIEVPAFDAGTSTSGGVTFSGPSSPFAGVTVRGFQGASQYDAASFGRNFIPPDTMGAVGTTQFVEPLNGVYAIFDKATGVALSKVSDVAFWAAAGQTGANGDSRVMFNKDSSKWVVLSFGASTSQIQIAVSDTADALGTWKSTKFTGFAGGTADYPTLAMDKNAIYIGTNNFKVGCDPSAPAANRFCGTTLNAIPLNSVFAAGGPSTTNMKEFVTPYTYGVGTDLDRGFAQQGVNSSTAGSTGKIVANSLFIGDNLTFKVTGLSPSSASGAALTGATYLGVSPLSDAGPGRQPATIVANQRVVDVLDQRISSSVYEVGGRIYSLQTVDGGADFARVRYTIVDSASGAILDQGNIGTGGFDYYQASLAVNSKGHVVIGYNRSGLSTADANGDGIADGVISFMAETFITDALGHLLQVGDEILLKASDTTDYHNGSVFGLPAAGRQRWGDYSQVSLDPNNEDDFWLVGQFAREYNLPAFGHPGGTGGSRWGTWIADITFVVVPEPGSLALVLGGIAVLVARRRRA